MCSIYVRMRFNIKNQSHVEYHSRGDELQMFRIMVEMEVQHNPQRHSFLQVVTTFPTVFFSADKDSLWRGEIMIETSQTVSTLCNHHLAKLKK